MGDESEPGTLQERRAAARDRHPASRAPVVLGDDAVELIGAGLLQRYYGTPYDPSGTFREVPLATEPLTIDLRESTRAKGLGPRQLRARWRAFRSYWFGHMLSVTGDHFTLIALPLAADRVSNGSAFVVSLVVFAETLSTVVFGTMAGTAADRRRPIPTMITTDLGRAAMLGLLGVLEWSGRLSAWMVIGMSFALGAFRLLHDGAESAFVAGLVPEELDVKSQARITLSENLGSTIGPLAAGAATGIGLWVSFGIDGLTFLFAAGAVALVARTAAQRHLFPVGSTRDDEPDDRVAYLHDLAATIRIIRAQSVFVKTLVVAALFNLLTLPVGAQFISLARHELGLGSFGIGVMFAITGVAGIIAAPIVERGSTIRPGLIVGATGAIAVTVLAAGLFPTVATVGVAFAAAGAGFAVAFTHYAALRQRLFQPSVQGRVALASRTVLWSTVLIGSVLTGWLADAHGPATMWVVCGAIGLATAAAGAAAGLLGVRYD